MSFFTFTTQGTLENPIERCAELLAVAVDERIEKAVGITEPVENGEQHHRYTAVA